LHRTHRQEGLTEEDLAEYYRALAGMARWSDYYSYEWPHSALNYLRPADYYCGDPIALLAERRAQLRAVAEARRAYWENQCYGQAGSLS